MNEVLFSGSIYDIDFLKSEENSLYCTGVLEDYILKKNKTYDVVRVRFIAYKDVAKKILEIKEKYGTPFYILAKGGIKNYRMQHKKRTKEYDIFKKRFPKLILQVYKVYDVAKVFEDLGGREKNDMILNMEQNIYDIYENND